MIKGDFSHLVYKEVIMFIQEQNDYELFREFDVLDIAYYDYYKSEYLTTDYIVYQLEKKRNILNSMKIDELIERSESNKYLIK